MSLRLSRILHPTDFSPASSAALEMAIELCRRFGAELILLHVHQVPAYVFPDGVMPIAPDLLQELERSIAAELERLAVQVRAADVRVSTRVAMGASFAEIVREARALEADLVVLGTHGRTGLRHALLGSVAEKVVRKAPCPVLTVRPIHHEAEHPSAAPP